MLVMATPQSECIQKLLAELWNKHRDGVKNLRLVVKDGLIEVSGEARSFYQKQMLSEALRTRTTFVISTRQLRVEKGE